MKKQLYAMITSIVLLSLLLSGALASQVEPRGDTEFAYANLYLSSSKTVSFSAETYEVKDCIYVKSCWLEKKVNGEWTYSRSLPAPTEKYYNDDMFGAVENYSDKIGSGTYRVACTYDADGHSITRYSNERTF